LISTAATTRAALAMNPNDSDARLTADSMVVAISAEPRTSSNSTLRRRDRSGSGRSLRGIAHNVAMAF
jgi:hypothetical protein